VNCIIASIHVESFVPMLCHTANRSDTSHVT
jgi:hypothetical protein